MTGVDRQRPGAGGFTLLEVVVTLIVISLLGALLAEVLGTGVQRSAEPIVHIQHGYRLTGVLDRITADYEEVYRDGQIGFADFKRNIENGNLPGNTPYYGDYTADTAYIVFQDGVETEDTAGTNRLLRVTVEVPGQAVTAVFSR